MSASCPNCGKEFTITPEYAREHGGGTSSCDECGCAFQIPEERTFARRAAELRIWTDGNMLVAPRGAKLPFRCVVCNQPAVGRRLRATFRYLPEEYSAARVNRYARAVMSDDAMVS